MTQTNKRFSLLDALRGFAIINVVIYHFLYDIYVVYGYNPKWPFLQPIQLWQALGAGLFILIAGMVLHLDKHGWRRGWQLNLLGLFITAITYVLMPEETIYYGILTFFGCAVWLGCLLRPLLRRVAPLTGIFLSAAGYLLTQQVDEGWIMLGSMRIWQWPEALYDNSLALLGFHDKRFASADYVPLLPHIFVFFGGWFLYDFLKLHRRLNWLQHGDWQIFTLPGRHSLAVYLLHQPLLLGACNVLLAE